MTFPRRLGIVRPSAEVLAAVTAIVVSAAAAPAGDSDAASVRPKSLLVDVPEQSRGSFEVRWRLKSLEGFNPEALTLYPAAASETEFLALGVERTERGPELVLREVSRGRRKLLGRAACPEMKPGEQSELCARFSRGKLLIHDGRRRLIECPAPALERRQVGIGPCPAAEFSPPLVQPTGEIVFADEFMRERGLGSWRRNAGSWAVSFVPNAETAVQAFHLNFAGQEPGHVTTGEWFWSDYVAAASVKAGSREGTLSLGFGWRSNGDYFLLRCRPPGEAPGAIELVRASGGDIAVLGGMSGSLIPGQWYRLKVLTQGDRAIAFIDDKLVASVRDERLTGGLVALSAHGGSASFDDVVVRSASIPQAEMEAGSGAAVEAALASAEVQTSRVTELFTREATMKDWATASGRWTRDGAFERCDTPLYGDAAFRWRSERPVESGALWLEISPSRAPEGGEPRGSKALTAVLQVDPAYGAATVRAVVAGSTVASKRFEAKPFREVVARLTNGRLTLSTDSGAELSTEMPPAPGGRLFAYRDACGDGGTAAAAGSSSVYDCTFSSALSDWFAADGTWQPHVRWTCDPRWSWFGGHNEQGRAWLWNKRRMEGDVSVEAYASFMMLRPGWPEGYDYPFNIRLALSNGPDPDSGYVFVYGNVDGPSQILRKGRAVAETGRYVEALHPDDDAVRVERIHRRWLHLQVLREGPTVRFLVDRENLLEFTDPEPLETNLVGFGTERNGMCLARVILSAERPGPRCVFLGKAER